MTRQLAASTLAAACLLAAAPLFAQSASQPPPAAQGDAAADLIKQGQQQLREGNLDNALATFKSAMDKASGPAVAASAALQAGITLDLMGRYAEARTNLARAVGSAPTPADKARASRAMAVSYAFERDCAGAEKYEAPLVQSYLDAREFVTAGEVANELARLCLESGNVDRAAEWYKRGHDAALEDASLKPEQKDLWAFRWEHAQARLAARRGQAAEAQKHVAAARAIFDKGTIPEQAPFVPYLVGYVAFYGGDYKTALSELQRGNQNDAFILCLIGQAAEKLGDKERAAECYRKVMTITAHNPTTAYARPIAREKLGIKGS